MNNECRYHARGNSIYLKGILRVRCFNGEVSTFEDLNEDVRMAQDLAKKLNYDLETLEMLRGERELK